MSPTMQAENVQVEISVDTSGQHTDMYSILVAEQDRVQSVVAVPREETTPRRRRRLKKSKSCSIDQMVVSGKKATTVRPGRRADSLRPLSPLQLRPTSMERTADRGRDRRPSASCPPPMNRSGGLTQQDRRREVSCPPPMTTDSKSPATNNRRASLPTKSRKPNLVLAASRKQKNRTMFRGSRNVVSSRVLAR